MVKRRSPPMDMPTTPMSQPLMTWPLPTLKEKGLPFLLATDVLVYDILITNRADTHHQTACRSGACQCIGHRRCRRS